MKAKVIETGEIVDVYHEPQHGQITNIYKESNLVNGRIWTEDELIFLNTLEVKDVDFETEWNKYFEYKGKLATINVKDLAKNFFDLGLKAQKGE